VDLVNRQVILLADRLVRTPGRTAGAARFVGSPHVSAVFGNLRPDAGLWGAQFALAQLRSRIAAGGVSAMRADPGLLAEVDQHTAAVRDALTEASGRVSAVC
jgi:hypothetical protein